MVPTDLEGDVIIGAQIATLDAEIQTRLAEKETAKGRRKRNLTGQIKTRRKRRDRFAKRLSPTTIVSVLAVDHFYALIQRKVDERAALNVSFAKTVVREGLVKAFYFYGQRAIRDMAVLDLWIDALEALLSSDMPVSMQHLEYLLDRSFKQAERRFFRDRDWASSGEPLRIALRSNTTSGQAEFLGKCGVGDRLWWEIVYYAELEREQHGFCPQVEALKTERRERDARS
jgi:hypothetical protein